MSAFDALGDIQAQLGRMQRQNHGSEVQSAAETAATASLDLAKARERMEALENTKTAPKVDWVAAYDRWHDFEDLEELEQREKTARDKAAAAASSAPQSCSHDHSQEQAVYDMSTGDKIVACRRFKGIGNLYFREGQWARAIGQYDLALAYFDYAFPDTDEEAAALDDVRFDCLLNSASAFLRIKDRKEALSRATQATMMREGHPKALFRRAQVHNALDNLEEARADILAALELCPHDAALRRELSIVASKSRAYRDSSGRQAQAMIQGQAPQAPRAPLDALLRGEGAAPGTESGSAGNRERDVDDVYELPPNLDHMFAALDAGDP